MKELHKAIAKAGAAVERTRPSDFWDQLDAWNERLDSEYEQQKKIILYTDRVERDIELTFGGKVNGGAKSRSRPLK